MDTFRELVFWDSLRNHPDIEIMCVKKDVVLLMSYRVVMYRYPRIRIRILEQLYFYFIFFKADVKRGR